MYEKEPEAVATNPVHQTCDIAIKNLANLNLAQCKEVIGHLKDYLADRKQHELNKLKGEIEELQYRVKSTDELVF